MKSLKEEFMKKVLLLSLMMFVGVLGYSNVYAKQVTQKKLQQCMDKLKKESAKKGYPITDPMVLRYKCMEILKK